MTVPMTAQSDLFDHVVSCGKCQRPIGTTREPGSISGLERCAGCLMARPIAPSAWSLEDVRCLLLTSNEAVERAMVVLYERQTPAEQSGQRTNELNGMGFSRFDAELLSSFAEQVRVNRWERPLGQRLSKKQMEIARKRVMKYAKQLHTTIRERAAVAA